MNRFLKKILTAVLCLSFALGLCTPLSVLAEENAAVEISDRSLVTDSTGFPSLSSFFDNNKADGWRSEDVASLTLQHEGGIGSLYLSFGRAPGSYTVRNDDTGICHTAGEQGFIHEFLDLTAAFGSAPKSVTLFFETGAVYLYELDIFSPGAVPDSIQKWKTAPEGEVDLMLFAAHGGDDQLFFAGLLPYYAVEQDYEVLVVYLTDHLNTTPVRIHEILNGLWACGIRNYPVFGPFKDFDDTHTMDGTIRSYLAYGWSMETMTGFVVEQLRRFKPMVAVGHDLNGEYNFGQHMVYAQLLADAVQLSADSSRYPDSAQTYGVWDVPKTYLHLYGENQTTLDLDRPMTAFDGLSPYQVSKTLGFTAHNSQSRNWSWFFSGKDKASQFQQTSPCCYGLYRSTVGEDVQRNDLFENVISHALQDQLDEEARLEAERLQAEEEARKAAEEEAQRAAEEASIAAEEAAKQAEEAARLAEEEARRKEAERLAEEERLQAEQEARKKDEQQEKLVFIILGIVGFIAVIATVSAIYMKLTAGKFSKAKRRKK